MSKKLCFALLLAGLGVSIASLQIHRFIHPPKGSTSGRFEDRLWTYEPGKVPHTPGRMPNLRSDATLARKLDLVQDYVAAKSWVEAAHVLQSILDSADDTLVSVERVGKDDEDVTLWTGLRAEAARLLSVLPAAGRDTYQTIFGPRAQALLAEARRKDDVRLVAEVVRRYASTSPGADALALLGAHHLDRGRTTLASLCFERLLDRSEAGSLPAATLVYAAAAFRRAGNGVRAEEAWNLLAAQAPAVVQLGGRESRLEDLRAQLHGNAVAATAIAAPLGLPAPNPAWSVPTWHEEATQRHLQRAEAHLDTFETPSIPAGVPLAVDNKIVYRSHRGVQAVDRRSGRDLWEAASPWSLDRLGREPAVINHVEEWIQAYVTQGSPHVLSENALLGTLSADGGRIYAVDDLAVPPYRRASPGGGRQPLPDFPDFGSELNAAASHNRLLALDASTGRTVWSVGGDNDSDANLRGRYFLGAPLPLDGRLYVLSEKDGDINLLCLERSGSLAWQLPLIVGSNRMWDVGRRIQSMRPVFGDGVLICPTYAGVVLGVDILNHGVVWAYPYLTAPLTQAIMHNNGFRRPQAGPIQAVSEWKAPLTVVRHGRVVFAAPDDPSIHCLDARDGSLIWKSDHAEEDVYAAGIIDDKVLVIGTKQCRALDLADGKVRWQLETGVPSAQGAAAGQVYYLPLRNATAEKAVAIYAIDVRRGSVIGRSKRAEPPGNLVIHDGDVLSQTPKALSAYAGRKERIQ